MNHWVYMSLSTVAHFQTTNTLVIVRPPLQSEEQSVCPQAVLSATVDHLCSSCVILFYIGSEIFCFWRLQVLRIPHSSKQIEGRHKARLQPLNPKLDTVSRSKGYKIFTEIHKIQCLHVFCSLTSYFLIFSLLLFHVLADITSCFCHLCVLNLNTKFAPAQNVSLPQSATNFTLNARSDS